MTGTEMAFKEMDDRVEWLRARVKELEAENTKLLGELGTQRKAIFSDVYDLLSKIVEEVGDTVWFDDYTTAHEALCDLAGKYDPVLAEQLALRLEDDC